MPCWASKTFGCLSSILEFRFWRFYSLGPIFLGCTERTFLVIRRTKALLWTKHLRRSPRKSSWESHSPQKVRPKMREVLIMMRLKPRDHPVQQLEQRRNQTRRVISIDEDDSRKTLWWRAISVARRWKKPEAILHGKTNVWRAVHSFIDTGSLEPVSHARVNFKLLFSAFSFSRDCSITINISQFSCFSTLYSNFRWLF